MSRKKGVLGSRIQMVGAQNPDGWSPESKWLKPGIQMVGARNPNG